MKVVDQNIPAELYGRYVGTLGQAAVWHSGSDIRTLKRREWYELIHSKSPPKGAPSAAQLAVRAAFKKCVDCFNASPKTGGVEPPAIGYRSKEWWYAASGELTWPDYIGKKKMSWDGDAADPLQYEDSNGNMHDVNWFLKTDEQDFIDFYNEMKGKYGYPWSAKNSPDQIVAKMNQIVCNEIEYDKWGDIYVFYTPGQTAKSRKGVCDDQSALHYALTWRALKELAWTDEQINNRLGALIVNRQDNRHMYNWWKSINGTTRIVENTYDPGDAPKVVGGMKYWGDDQPYYLVQLFNKTGHQNPWFIGNGDIYALWYYNYFIHKSWGYFYADKIPDWCGCVVPCDSVQSSLLKFSGDHYGDDFDAIWSEIYTNFQAASWEDSYLPQVFYCYGTMTKKLFQGLYNGRIQVNKTKIVFKPVDYISQKKWDEVDLINVIMIREIMGGEFGKAGGAIKCIETGEIIEQTAGWNYFVIPKDKCDFNEFTLEFEGLCRNIGDLKPDVPEYYNESRYVGSFNNIYQYGNYNTKLLIS